MKLTYCLTDIHGMKLRLDKALQWIENDAKGSPYKIVFLGDYVDRGPDSKGVLDTLINLSENGPQEYVFILGNHDEMMLYGAGSIWTDNGGDMTLASFGLSVYDYDKKAPKKYYEFLESCVPYHEDEEHIYVHAGINPITWDGNLANQTDEDLRWIRYEFLRHEKSFGKLVVHGHTVTKYDPFAIGRSMKSPVVVPNRINLDTGCVFGGFLTVGKFDESNNFSHQLI